MLQDQAAQDAIEAVVVEREAPRQVVGNESHVVFLRLPDGLRHHFRGEVDCRHPGACFRQIEGVATRAAADVGDPEFPDVPQQGPHQRLFQNDQGIVLGVVGFGPASVALPNGYDLGNNPGFVNHVGCLRVTPVAPAGPSG